MNKNEKHGIVLMWLAVMSGQQFHFSLLDNSTPFDIVSRMFIMILCIIMGLISFYRDDKK